jgi:hypothetical protein
VRPCIVQKKTAQLSFRLYKKSKEAARPAKVK